MDSHAKTDQKVPFVDLRLQHQPLREALLASLARVVDSGEFCLGSAVAEFETAWAAYVGVKYAVGLQSGTSAIMAALAAIGVGPDDEVVTATNTFVATVGAIHFMGARPVLVDVDPVTYTIDPAAVQRALTPHTRAIIPVHLYGQMAEMRDLLAIAEHAGVTVLEDAAQAHGARYANHAAGTMGRLACFSFYPGKNLGALGEAGAVTTDDAELAARVRMFRNHGGVNRYEHLSPGLNARMSGFQGAVLGCKLPHLDGWNHRRRQIAARYCEGLAGLPVVLPAEAEGRHHVHHLYVIQTEERDALQAHLQRRGIATGIHYPAPVHLLPAYRHLGYGEGDFPVAERLCRRILSLPIFPEMEDGMVDLVMASVRDFYHPLRKVHLV